MLGKQATAMPGMATKPSLGQLIHAALIAHLLLVATVLALIVGAATYNLRSQEIAEDVLDTVRYETEIVQAKTGPRAQKTGLPLSEAGRAVDAELQPALLLSQAGRLLSVEVCQRDGAKALLWADPYRSLPDARPCRAYGREALATSGSFGHDVVRDRGQLYVLARTPPSAGPEAAEGEVLSTFILSDKTRRELEGAAIARASLAALIVLLTTLALYPAILFMVRRIGRLTESLLRSNLEMLQVLGGAIAQRDGDTGEHNCRVSLYAVRLAEALNLGRADIQCLLKGALLHDVGKIGIPDRILLKPGPLSESEMQTMRQHVRLGLDTIARSAWLADAAAVVGFHHEWVDGSGYPHGLAGEAIPLAARIFAIADVFDALCAERPYKKALAAGAALDIMRAQAGAHFDRRLFDIFEGIADDLHVRYSGCGVDELRAELNAALAFAFSDRTCKLDGAFRAFREHMRRLASHFSPDWGMLIRKAFS